MNKYTGASCAACGEPFKDSDDIVVCPICGAPHHRVCYLKENKCAHSDKHGTAQEWNSHESWSRENEKKFDGDAPLRCPRCNTLNPLGSIFCQVCGTKLNAQSSASPPPQNPSATVHGPYVGYNNPDNGPTPISYNPFTTPYGGLSPDEEIEGVSTRDLVLYLGENSHYFLPKFKQMKTGTKFFSWNWSAFFFNFAYMFYRKMNVWGVIFLAFYVAVQIPMFLLLPNYIDYLYASLQSMTVSPELTLHAQNYLNYCSFANILLIGLNVFSALCANRFYMNKAFKDILKIREPFSDRNSEEYIMLLSQKGRTNKKVIVLFLILFAIINFVLPVIMVYAIV